MTTFQTLFGIKESHVKNTCLLLPLLRKDILKGLKVKNFSRGRLYGSGNSKSFTVIHTGVGPALLGDSVLYLNQTPCQNIILFGSCGLVKEEKDLTIGDLVTPTACYAQESFTRLLLNTKSLGKPFYPDKGLLEKLSNEKIQKVTCSTLGSLKLEEGLVDSFTEKGIDVVDMECSALFSAAGHTGKKAMALFYLTDIINKKPFYRDSDKEDIPAISSSIKTAIHILCNFIEKNLTG